MFEMIGWLWNERIELNYSLRRVVKNDDLQIKLKMVELDIEQWMEEHKAHERQWE